MADQQHTVSREVTFEGIGLHSGLACQVILAPADPDSGIVFRRRGSHTQIRARSENVVDAHYATTLGVLGCRVRTVEHLMAAAAGLAIDNLLVTVEGPEVPAADGSAGPFVALLRSAGRRPQAAPRTPIVVKQPIRVGADGRWIQIVPSDRFHISYTLSSTHPAIGTQALSCAPVEDVFVSDLAPARTYGFLKDVPELRRRGLAQGGSLANAVVIGKRTAVNALRYPDEFVRHKALDLIGDLALLGRPVLGRVIARNAGHALNLALVSAIERLHQGTNGTGSSPRAPEPRAATPGFAAL